MLSRLRYTEIGGDQYSDFEEGEYYPETADCSFIGVIGIETDHTGCDGVYLGNVRLVSE